MTQEASLQYRAKKTLVYLSQHQQGVNQVGWEQFSEMGPIHIYKQTQPLFRNKINRKKSVIPQFINKRPILMLRKVSVQNQTFQIQCLRKKKIKDNKENSRPTKTMRKFYSLSKKTQQKQQQQGFNFINYWIKHRFEQGSINALVQRIKQNRSTTPIVRS